MCTYWKSTLMIFAVVALAACAASPKAVEAPASQTAAEAAPADTAAEHHDMAGCEHHDMAGSEHHDMAGSEQSLPDLKAPGEAKVGDNTTCPVSGKKFTVTEESASAEYKGKTYYFCCPGCDRRFQKDREKYTTH